MSTKVKAYRPKYQQRFDELALSIADFEANVAVLPGIIGKEERAVLINQLIDSERRNTYFAVLRNRAIPATMVDPHSDQFDPLRAAIHHWKSGEIDEACWLAFQFVHFGKHPVSGWRYVREVYGRLNSDPIWSWEEISINTPEFRLWLGDHQDELLRRDQRRGFGNHRKYSSLNHESNRGTASVYESYVELIMAHGSHNSFFAAYSNDSTPTSLFEALYNALEVVVDFGRIAKFDYLMTLSRLGFLNVQPGHAYLQGATGPLRGARLLVQGEGGNGGARELSPILERFSAQVGVTSDVIEDAICNWQKSPNRFQGFVL